MATAHPEESTSRRRVRRAALVVGALTAGLLVAPALTDTEPEAVAAELDTFTDCAEVDAWYTGMTVQRVGPWGLDGPATEGGWLRGWFGTGGAETAAGAAAGAADAGATSPEAGTVGDAVGPGASGTNVQEAGVDQPDVVKTDGDRVVTVTGGSLHVLHIDGPRLREVGSLALDRQVPQELLLLNDRALLISIGETTLPEPEPLPEPEVLPQPDEDDMPSTVPPERSVRPALPTTVLTVVDLSDGSRPRLVRTEEVEASYLSARASGNGIRVVLTSTPTIPFPEPRIEPSGELTDSRAAEAANRAALEAMSGADWLPQRVVRDEQGDVVDRMPAVDCTAVTHPPKPAGVGTVTVLTLDADDAELDTTDTTAVSADGGMVYASADRLYVATTRGGWGFPMPVDSLLGGLTAPFAGERPAAETQLHGFDTSDPSKTPYLASGSVPGWLLGRWAMSARDGLLRVATTIDTGDDPTTGTEAVVTVLREAGDALEPVGSVGGLGKGEQIRAVRWFDDLAVVVTFRQTDPLYTVDLSNAAAPAVVGELKIPGYSAYLHPVGAGLVLGVGQDATDTGQTTGAQVSSFDLRELAAPDRVDTLTYRNAWSDVEGESRAFSYLPQHRLALVPLSAGEASGVVAVRVGEDGSLAESGRWTPGTGWHWLLRAIPVGTESVVALTESEDGRTVTLLQTPDLREVDRVLLLDA